MRLFAAEYLWRPEVGLEVALTMTRSAGLSGVLSCTMADQALAGSDPRVSVNVDANLLEPTLARALVRSSGQHAHRLIIEIGEGTELHPQWYDACTILRSAGIMLAVDDAGTAYADVARIQMLRPQLVKLDRSLLAPTAANRVQPLIAMAHQVGARVIAEGVENVYDLTRAHAMGVDAVQGFMVNRIPCLASAARVVASTD
jgi:EAL domain-containing protein (putative c-di-GMP-specific phosphodiesterase class I)